MFSFLQSPISRFGTEKNYTIINGEMQSTLSPVLPIQTVKGRVVFFRVGREKISTLIPLTVWIFAVAFRRRKRGTGFQKSRSPFPSAPFYGKTGSTTAPVADSFCGAARPAPPASPKEQNGRQGLLYLPSTPQGGFRPARDAYTPFLPAGSFLSQRKMRP